MSNPELLAELAPTGVLRAGINLGNYLLVTGRSASDEPMGVSPDLARAVADRLGVPVAYVAFERPDTLADAVNTGAWDIGLISAEPARAEKITFSAAYAEIEATYLVPPGSPLCTIADVDRPGIRISVSTGSAYDLWLQRNLRHASIVPAQTLDDSYDVFLTERLDALAGLRTRLLQDAESLPGSRVLDGSFTTVQQAIGTSRANTLGTAFLQTFVEEAKASGLIVRLIAQHKVHGLAVAPVMKG